MTKKNRGWCGRHAVNERFCDATCEDAHAYMMSKPCQAFRSHLQASKYLGKDVRTIRRYEGLLYTIDKTLSNPRAHQLICKVCEGTYKAGENRNGYCPNCSKAG